MQDDNIKSKIPMFRFRGFKYCRRGMGWALALMLTAVFVVLGFGLFLPNRTEAALGDILWTNPDSIQGSPHHVVVDNTGVYAAGSYWDTSTNLHWRLEKRNLSNGAVLWSRQLDGLTGAVFKLQDIAIDNSGIYVAITENEQWRLEKYDLDGKYLWTAFSPENNKDFISDIALDSAGVYIGISEETGNRLRQQSIVKIDLTNGKVLKRLLTDLSGTNSIASIAVDSSNLYIIDSNNNPFVEKLNIDLSSNVPLWKTALTGMTTMQKTKMVADGTGVYVGGSDAKQWFMYKLNPSDGIISWTQLYRPSNNPSNLNYNYNDVRGMAIDNSGVYFGGRDSSNGYYNQWSVQKRNLSDGKLIWEFSSPVRSTVARSIILEDIAIDNANVYVASSSYFPDWYIEKRSIYSQKGERCQISTDCASNAPQCDPSTNTCVEPMCASAGKTPDAFGREWTEIFRSPNGGVAYGYGTAVDSAGNVYLTGEALNAETATSGLDVFLRKYDKDGNLQWTQYYDNGGNESGYGVAVSQTNDVYVTGRQDTKGGDMLLLSYKKNTGDFQWAISRDVAGGTDIGKSVAISLYPYGVYVSGHRQTSGGDTDAMLWVYDHDGLLIREHVFRTVDSNGVDLNESGNSVAVSGSAVYLTGYKSSGNGDMFLIKYNTAGVLQWTQIYDSTVATMTKPTTRPAQKSSCVDISNDSLFLCYSCGYRTPFFSIISESVAPYRGIVKAIASSKLLMADDTTGVRMKLQCNGSDCSSVACEPDGPTPNPRQIMPITLSTNFPVPAGSKVTLMAQVFEDNVVGDVDCQAWDSNEYCNYTYPLFLGDIKWDFVANPPGTDIGRGVAVSHDGATVFVTGYQSTNGGDMFTRAYNTSDGVSKWSEVYDSGAAQNDIGRGIVTGVNGRTFTAGSQKTNGEDMFLRVSDLAAPLQQIVRLYKGAVSGGNVSQEIGYGVARDLNKDEIYVAGYQDSNGGEAFLNKYSCNDPRVATSVSNGAFTVSPGTTGFIVGTRGNPDFKPFTVNVDAMISGVDIKLYEWDWNYTAGNFSASGDVGVKQSHSYDTAGNYVIALRATDNAGHINITTQAIRVLNNHLPTANFKTATSTSSIYVSGPVSGVAPLTVKVDGSASSDEDAPLDHIKSFTWQWGDGTADGQGEKTTHLYSSEGAYTIKLIVTDSNNATGSVSVLATVTRQYVCASDCSKTSNTPVCRPKSDGSGNECVACVSGSPYQCKSGFQCLGTVCKAGQKCADGSECPADGVCSESVACKVGAVGVCDDGFNKYSDCPASGWCAPKKNICVLGSETLATQCYTEANGKCTTDLDCAAGVQGGTCDNNPESSFYQQCKYAHCLNTTDTACEKDKDCNNSDGVCDPSKKICDYVYDCAYGPGMNSGATTTAAALVKTMPPMPVGVQPDGQACTKPTPDAPTNCEGINGCLYYNYYINTDKVGVAMEGDANNPIGNGVASCLNKFEGGTGCVYYGNQNDPVNSRINCLPGTDFTKLKSKTAPYGIPLGCVEMSKGGGKKEYDCSGVDGCYYYLNGTVDCDYKDKGTGCFYEPNPAGAQMCPKTVKPPTAGEDFVQCLLNPDATLPWFLLGSGASGLSSCRVNADCPASAPICIDGTCFSECQGNTSCVTGQQCVDTCATQKDCQTDCQIGTTCANGTACVANDLSPTGGSCLAACNSGVCQTIVNPSGSFSCSDATAVHKISYGAASADISVSSSQNTSCRWSLFDVPFVSMIGPGSGSFSTGDSINHTATATGISNGSNTIFVGCDTGSGQTASCSVPLIVGSCSSGTYCPTGVLCPANGICPQAPVCADAQPLGSLPYSTLASGTAVSMTTDLNSNCVRSNDYNDTNQCIAPILSCVTAAKFDTTGGKAHSSVLAGSPPLVVGNNTQYVKCQETESTDNKLSDVCSIPFNIGTCDPHKVVNECSNGWDCVAVGSGPGICIPPACSGAKPSLGATLPYTATSTDIGLTTKAPSTCAYSDNYDTPYSAMTTFFDVTGGLTHSTNIDVAWNSEVYKYVKCRETATGTTTPACTIHFKVGDLLLVCADAHPKGQQEVGVDVPIGMTTNQSALCKFSDSYDALISPENRYNNMSNTFRNIAGITHGTDGTLQDTVTVVQGDNTKYAACRETSAPNKITECRIPFSGGSCQTSFDCALGMVCNASSCKDCDTNPDLPECHIVVDHPPPLPCPPFCPPPPPPPPEGGSCNTLGYEFHGTAITPSGNCDLLAIILALLNWLAWFIALLAVLSGLRAAYLYITSAGDDKKLRLAYSYLIYTSIGVAVAVLSFGAVAITRAILNI